jgi:hypothetical protein
VLYNEPRIRLVPFGNVLVELALQVENLAVRLPPEFEQSYRTVQPAGTGVTTPAGNAFGFGLTM